MQDDEWKSDGPDNWDEFYQSSIDKAKSGDTVEGRWLFQEALGYLKRNHSIPEILRLYLVHIMKNALDGDSKNMAKHLNITKPNCHPEGKNIKRDYEIALWVYMGSKESDKTLAKIIEDATNYFPVEIKTIERAYKKYRHYVELADEFPDLTKDDN